MSFFPLKDSYGMTQLVVVRKKDLEDGDPLLALSDVPPESVVLIKGQVRMRPPNSTRRVCESGLLHNVADLNLLI